MPAPPVFLSQGAHFNDFIAQILANLLLLVLRSNIRIEAYRGAYVYFPTLTALTAKIDREKRQTLLRTEEVLLGYMDKAKMKIADVIGLLRLVFRENHIVFTFYQ